MLTDLAGKISHKQLERLLRNTEPEFREEYGALLEQIRQQNSEQVIRLAHSLKNTASLFGCQELVDCLKKIEQSDLAFVSQNSFQQQLEQEYRVCLELLRQLSDSP